MLPSGVRFFWGVVVVVVVPGCDVDSVPIGVVLLACSKSGLLLLLSSFWEEFAISASKTTDPVVVDHTECVSNSEPETVSCHS